MLIQSPAGREGYATLAPFVMTRAPFIFAVSDGGQENVAEYKLQLF